MNLLALVKNLLTTAAVSKISASIGESTTATQAAIGAAMPAILGGIMQNASTTQGTSELLDLLRSGGHDGKMLNSLSDSLGDATKIKNISNVGSGLLNDIFGDKLSNVTHIISTVSGLGQESSSALLNLAAPIIMGVIGKQVKSQGLGIAGLINLLTSQKDSVTKALPAGMGSILDINKLGDFVGHGKSMSSVDDTVVEEKHAGFGKYWLPLLLVALLGLGAIFYMKQCQNPVSEPDVATIDSTAAPGAEPLDSTVLDSPATKVALGADTATRAGQLNIAALGSFLKRKLPNGIELNIPEKGIESNLIKFIEDKTKRVDKISWFNFDRILFDTGKISLKPASEEQIKNISEILKAYPKVDMKIGGYTDNSGDSTSNVKLSADRANAVMNALVKNGVNASRLLSAGYGEKFPSAPNNTEENRAKNRRIAVRITKK